MANPPLSSVVHNGRRIGYEAAAMLDRLISRKKVMADIVVDPLGVTARQSTDLLAIEDPEVAGAVRFIREHACEGIRVDDVLKEVAMSRRSVEKRFRQAVGRPPHMEIRRVQLERVKQLLVGSEYKLERLPRSPVFHRAISGGAFPSHDEGHAWGHGGRAGRGPLTASIALDKKTFTAKPYSGAGGGNGKVIHIAISGRPPLGFPATVVPRQRDA